MPWDTLPTDVNRFVRDLAQDKICESPFALAAVSVRELFGLDPGYGCVRISEDQARAIAASLDIIDGREDGIIHAHEIETYFPGREIAPLDIYLALKLDDLNKAKMIADQVTSLLWRYDIPPGLD